MADFLAALMDSFAGQAGQTLFNLVSGGGKSRPSWRDLQFMQDASERLAPRQIALQGDFLEGLAPSQAAAYNTYQDATFQGDTNREISRIQQMGDTLGMSPWELRGTSGSAALPSPQMQTPSQTAGASTQAFMSALVPLEVAKIQARTQLASQAMQSDTAKAIAQGQQDTQRETTQMSNDTAKAIAEYAQTGPKAVQETAKIAAETITEAARNLNMIALTGQTEAQTAYTKGQTTYLGQMTKESEARIAQSNATTEATRLGMDQTRLEMRLMQREDVRNSLAQLATLIPKERFEAGGYTREGLAQSDPLAALARHLAEVGSAEHFDNATRDYINGLNQHDLSALAKAGILAGKAVEDIFKTVGNTVTGRALPGRQSHEHSVTTYDPWKRQSETITERAN